MMSHPLQELHRGWLSPLQCRTDAVQSRNLEEGDCTKRALTVEHMATNICKNVSPVNRLAAKSSCNWWLRGRGHNHLRINRCHPLALTSFCFFLLSFFLLSIPFWAHSHWIHTANTILNYRGALTWHNTLPSEHKNSYSTVSAGATVDHTC